MTNILNYTALRAYAYTPGNESVFVEGYNAAGDGAQGAFFWDPSAIELDNDGTVIKVTSVATGRWRRLYSGAWNIQWFGVFPSGTGFAVKINAAIAAAAVGSTISFPPGHYPLTSQIIMKSGITLKGSDNITVNQDSQVCIDVSFGANLAGKSNAAVLMKSSSCLKGLAFYYPAQNTAGTPVPYPYTITTDYDNGVGNTDNIQLENILLYNSYLGINLDQAGRFNLFNIYGSPIAIGLYIDRVYDVGKAINIHFWPFNTAFSTWTAQNGTAFQIYRIDGCFAAGWFAYGYRNGIYLSQNNSGPAWIDFSSCLIDVCSFPVYIDKANLVTFIGGELTNASPFIPLVSTSADIGNNVSFVGTKFTGGSSIGAVISSNTGQVQFSGCTFAASANNGVRVPVIVEGNCAVNIDGGYHDASYPFYGQDNVRINGVKLPKLGTLTNLGVNFATPSNWAQSIPGTVTSAATGINMTFTSNNGVCDLPLASLDTNLKYNIGVLELDINAPANSPDSYLQINIQDSITYENFTAIWGSINGMINLKFDGSGSSLKLFLPVFIGEHSNNLRLRVECHTYATANTIIYNIQNIKLYLSNNPDQQTTDMVLRDFVPNATNRVSKRLTANWPNRIVYTNVAPTGAIFADGDKAISISPSVNNVEYWLYKTGTGWVPRAV